MSRRRRERGLHHVNLSDLSATEVALGAGGIVTVIAWIALIVVPAWCSYGRWWERIAASFMTIFILVTLVGIGVGIGAIVFFTYDRWA